MRLFPLLLSLSIAAGAAAPSLAGTKKHSHAASAAAAHVKAVHLIHLAAKEKKEWRDHLAKLRELPHAERVAEKHHEHVWKRKHDAKVEVLQAAHAAKVAAGQAEARRAKRAQRLQARLLHEKHRLPRIAARPHPMAAPKASSNAAAHARRVAVRLVVEQAAQNAAHARQAARQRRLAAQGEAAGHAARARQAAQERNLAAANQAAQMRQAARARAFAVQEAARQENAAHRQALLRARVARQQSVRAQHLANALAAYRARLANLQASHNARAAAERSHWIALHGDGSGGKSIRFWQTAAAGVPVKVISVDLNDPNIKVSAVMARRGNGTSEPFRQMIDRANPNVAVTGTFFSLNDLQPVGDIVIDGSLVHFGGMGTALCITPSNHADMVTCDWGRHHDWSPYDFVVACGPRLLRQGRVVLDPHAERFHDQHMLAPNSRIAVGITSGNTLFFAMTHDPIYLGKLARVMQALGASEAMNLDAGTSTGFYYNGATLARPGRNLTNMIVVYGRRDRYERALDQLIPAAYHRTATRYRRQVSQALPPPASLAGR